MNDYPNRTNNSNAAQGLIHGCCLTISMFSMITIGAFLVGLAICIFTGAMP